MLQKIKHLARRALGVDRILGEFDTLKILAGRRLSNSLPGGEATLCEVEFKVFSQWGDDGIIQYLVKQLQLPTEMQSFVEFGVENYEESNTRFLLVNNNWRGLVMDGDDTNVAHIKGLPWFWRHDLTAVAAFVDRDNINDLIANNGFKGKIGLLHVDIDGNDYWVWKNITAVQPALVIAEYNSVFGASHAVTIPYDAQFQRSQAHYSNLYFGASLAALAQLADEKGYVFLGCNSAGNNAYFVQRELSANFKAVTVQQGYVESRFRESRGPNRELSLLRGSERLRAIKDLTVVDVKSGRKATIGEVYGC